jgi:hypothetical protein
MILLIVDLLRLDDEAPRRTGEGGVKDAVTRRQRRAAGEPVFWRDALATRLKTGGTADP